MEIVRRVSLEEIYFSEFSSIPKISEQFVTLIELLSVLVFDTDLKSNILDLLVSFDEVILLDLWFIVDSDGSR